MTHYQAIEHRIIRRCLLPRDTAAPATRPGARRLIMIVASAAALLAFGSLAPELVVAAVAASALVALAGG